MKITRYTGETILEVPGDTLNSSVMRGGALSKPEGAKVFHPKRVADPEHRRKIRALPCVACKIKGLQQTEPTQGHHIKRKPDGSKYGRGQKAGDHEMIPLCAFHHWNGIEGKPYWTMKSFEAEFGNELELLAITQEMLKQGE